MANRPQAGLIAKEELFVASFVRCCDVQTAAKAAGYSHGAAGYEVIRRPAVVEAIAAQRAAMLRGELVPMALGALRDILKGGTNREKAQAAEIVRKWAIDSEGTAAADRKPISEMSAEELDQEIQRIRRLQADRSKPILDLAPVPIENVETIGDADPFA